MEVKRMWINQPSTLQPEHRFHGLRVLAVDRDDLTMMVYWLSGPVVSQVMLRACLSPGWPVRGGEDDNRVE